MLTTKQQDKIKGIISTTLAVKENEIGEFTSFMDWGADSFDQVEILLGIEREFSIKIPDDEFAKVKTFGELCDAVDRQLKKHESNRTPIQHKDEIDKWLFEEMQLMPGCCSSIQSTMYDTARRVAEKLWPKSK